MQMFLRLYDPADIDLIYLKLKYRNKFPKMIRKCLHGHISNNGGSEISFDGNPAVFAKHPKKPMVINLNLKPVEDDDIIQFLSGIRDYAKSDVVKTIIRSRYQEFPTILFQPPFISAVSSVSSVDPSSIQFKKVKIEKKDDAEDKKKDGAKNEAALEEPEKDGKGKVGKKKDAEKKAPVLEEDGKKKPSEEYDEKNRNKKDKALKAMDENKKDNENVNTAEKNDDLNNTEEPMDAFSMLEGMING